MKSFTRMLTRLLPLAVLFVAPAFSAELHGTVTSGENQAPITGVSVLVRGPAGVRLTSLTDDQGVYRLTGLDKSLRYSIEVNAEGFKPFRQDVQISSESQQIDIHLDLSSVLESVVVKGSGEVISTVSNAPSVSETIPLAEIAELPTSNRNVTKYALLNPHVRQTQGLNSDGNNGNRLSINAQSSRHTAYVTDGVINYDWVYANGPFQLVSASAVEDVSVLTNQYAAEYGTTTAGIVKIDTQSGTNQLGGEAFAFVIPSGIQANPPVSTFHTPNEREQWGGLLGGTLVKDKTFFFGSYEGIRQVRGSFIQSPTPGFFVGQGDEIYGLTRVDQNFTDNHAISIRLNGYHYRNTNANDRVGGFNQISFGRIERSQSWGGQVTDRLIIGHLLNYLRFNFSVFSPDNNTPTGPFSPSVGINRPSYSVSGFSQFNWDRAKLVDLSDTVAFNGGRNNFKFGVEAVRVKVQDFLTSLYGTYNFPAGPPTPGKNPLNYTQTFGAAFLRFGETSVQTFAQDDFKISSRVSGNLGLRYEHQSFMDSPHNFAPRVGLAWDVMGDGKTRVTAGAGLFFDMIPLIQLRDALRNGVNAPLRTYTIPFGVPGFPTFPNSLTAPPAGIQAARLDLTIRPAKYLNPYSVQTSVGVERDLGRKFVVMANGIYAHTVHQLRNFDINHPAPFIRTAPGQVRSAGDADATRPFTTFMGLPVRRVVEFQNINSSTYEALDLGVRRLFASSLQTEAHYVLANSVTYGIFDNYAPNDWDNLGSAERGPSDFYQRHRFVGNAIVDLPHGFSIASIVTVGSGPPVNPVTGTDNNGDSFTTDRPVICTGCAVLGRDSFRTPRQADVDLSVSKMFTLSDWLRVQTRGEAFNVFNHRNYFSVNNVYGNGVTPVATFLRPVAGIANVDPARRIQFGLRFLFGRRAVGY